MEGTGSVAIDNSGAIRSWAAPSLVRHRIHPNAAALGSGGFALNGGDLEITSNAGSLSFTNAINVTPRASSASRGNLTLSGNVAGMVRLKQRDRRDT